MLWLTPVARLRRIIRWVTGDPSSPLAGKRVMLIAASSGIGEAERPLTVDRWIGRLGEWVGILTPRFSDSVMYRYDRQRADSAAARGEPVG